MRNRLGVAALISAMLAAACSAGSAPVSQPSPPPPRVTALPPVIETTTTTTPTTMAPTTTTTTTSTTLPIPEPPAVPAGETVCDQYSPSVRVVGQVTSDALNEISGIVVSRTHRGVIWAHNDSGGGARFFALGPAGEVLAAYALEGALPLDWEDIAIGPGPDPERDYLYLGDIGDNLRIRDSITVFRVPEPDPAGGDGVIEDYTPIRLAFPGEPEDSEALIVDPVTGDLLVITKRTLTRIFHAAANDLGSQTVEMRELRNFRLGEAVTAADISPSGDRVVFRGYGAVWMWPRLDREFDMTFAVAACNATAPEELQGEAIGFVPDGGYITISEGIDPLVNFVPAAEP